MKATAPFFPENHSEYTAIRLNIRIILMNGWSWSSQYVNMSRTQPLDRPPPAVPAGTGVAEGLVASLPPPQPTQDRISVWFYFHSFSQLLESNFLFIVNKRQEDRRW